LSASKRDRRAAAGGVRVGDLDEEDAKRGRTVRTKGPTAPTVGAVLRGGTGGDHRIPSQTTTNAVKPDVRGTKPHEAGRGSLWLGRRARLGARCTGGDGEKKAVGWPTGLWSAVGEGHVGLAGSRASAEQGERAIWSVRSGWRVTATVQSAQRRGGGCIRALIGPGTGRAKKKKPAAGPKAVGGTLGVRAPPTDARRRVRGSLPGRPRDGGFRTRTKAGRCYVGPHRWSRRIHLHRGTHEGGRPAAGCPCPPHRGATRGAPRATQRGRAASVRGGLCTAPEGRLICRF